MAILRRPQAIIDLEEISDYIAEQNVRAALRFLDAAERSFRLLEILPLSGRACRFRSPVLAGVRKRPIQGFRKYVIYYMPIADGIEILRVIYGPRDRGQLLGEVFDDENENKET